MPFIRARYLRRMAASLIAIAALVGIAPATSVKAKPDLNEVQHAVEAAWRGRYMTLRSLPRSDTIDVGCAGQLSKAMPQTSWTLSWFTMTGVRVRAKDTEVEGARLASTYDSKKRTWSVTPIPGRHMKIRIRCAATTLSGDGLQTLGSGLFFDDTAEMIQTVPDYWRPYLQGTAPAVKFPSQPDRHAAATQAGAPWPVKDPDPDYTPAARALRLTGTLVIRCQIETDGQIHDCEILQPLGAGLDESAMRALKKWRFKPGTKDGKPISKSADIAFSFHLLP